MQKFGEGQVERDPEDPQGVPTQQGVEKTASQEVAEAERQRLAQENREADSGDGDGLI